MPGCAWSGHQYQLFLEKMLPMPRRDVAHTTKKAQPLNEMLVMTKRNVAHAKQDAAHAYKGRNCQIQERMLPILKGTVRPDWI